ncbi:pilus assembly protein PilP [Undibacterium luofuense]|uniref:Pilus assembly protein PilP n=1 Tax=Undibacterium luofuense TaxID=2828733 RepID=A0A941DIZ1_9BURK|nr:pilus assembly protein PilP [Undibacterium luofuense]MBR7780870.1 pilus assembly protein PilP [Undibacterium luofuense]
MRSKLTMLSVLVSTLWLSGCGQDDSTELRDWMESVKKETRLVVPKLNPPKTYMPVPYEVKADIDPFNPEKLMAVLARMKDNGGRLKPNMERPREELESFPLDTLKMVGLIEKNGLKLALIQSDKKVYQAKLGGYIGQNFGLIVKISESEIQIKETVQDAAGDWVEREAKLELQGSQK